MVQDKKVDMVELAWKIEDVLQAASAGDYSKRCDVSITESFAENPLTTIVPSINLLLDDLRTKERRQRKTEAKLKETIRELEYKVDTIRKQAEAIRELSTPAIEVLDGVLIMPIIGVVDTLRGQRIMDATLAAVARSQARYVIMDITGVDLVDTAVADHLFRVLRAGKVLGAECMITGISPAVAQTLTRLGTDFSDVLTLRSLKEGIAYCLRGLGTDFKR